MKEVNYLASWDFDQIKSLVSRCSDQLDRVKRFLDGDVRTNRGAFRADVSGLRRTALSILRFSQTAERELAQCGAKYAYTYALGGEERGYCGLPEEHRGPHRAHREAEPLEAACADVQEMADVAADIAERLGWLAPSIDRHLAIGIEPSADDLDQLHELAHYLDSVGSTANRLAGRIQDLDAGARHAGSHPVALEGPVQIVKRRLDQIAAPDPNQVGLV